MAGGPQRSGRCNHGADRHRSLETIRRQDDCGTVASRNSCAKGRPARCATITRVQKGKSEMASGDTDDELSMKRNTRSLLAFGMAVLTAAPVIYGAALWRSRRPLVSLEDLLPVSPAFPVAWPTGDLEVSNLNWRVSEED